jgi:hypothetical protein
VAGFQTFGRGRISAFANTYGGPVPLYSRARSSDDSFDERFGWPWWPARDVVKFGSVRGEPHSEDRLIVENLGEVDVAYLAVKAEDLVVLLDVKAGLQRAVPLGGPRVVNLYNVTVFGGTADGQPLSFMGADFLEPPRFCRRAVGVS